MKKGLVDRAAVTEGISPAARIVKLECPDPQEPPFRHSRRCIDRAFGPRTLPSNDEGLDSPDFLKETLSSARHGFVDRPPHLGRGRRQLLARSPKEIVPTLDKPNRATSQKGVPPDGYKTARAQWVFSPKGEARQ